LLLAGRVGQENAGNLVLAEMAVTVAQVVAVCPLLLLAVVVALANSASASLSL
jgi:hypothetical protein